jgi:hypothetical protein
MDKAEFARAVSNALREEANHVLEDVSIGITGTRNPLTDAQRHTLGLMLMTIMHRVPRMRAIHHGCATGADEYAHQITLTIPGSDIYGHPGYGANKRQPYLMPIVPEQFTILYPAKTYRERNLDIVTYSRLLIACPAYPEQDARSARSGTWQTVRFARKVPIPVLLVIPNGGIIHDDRYTHTER